MDATLRLVGLHELGRVASSGHGLDSVQIGVRADAIARDLAARGIAMEVHGKAGKTSRG
jgi:hypothetical protein